MISSPWLAEAAFTQAVAALLLVSIDLCITDAQDNLFLGQRNNAPAKQWWFTPGVRIRKNEAIGDALCTGLRAAAVTRTHVRR